MKIPVFVSAPSDLNPKQQESYDWIMGQLDAFNLERRALGRSDYPTELPLREVVRLCRKVSGGLVLGFTQHVADTVAIKPGTEKKGEEPKTVENAKFPTPWNNLEAGILFSMGLPLLIFKEEGISGGVFDNGVTDVFLHKMPTKETISNDSDKLREVFLRWQGKVRAHYYED